ncbi:MAG: sugar phosphate isomerase/epimerase family protein [Christensenellales bacterium]|jgi:inosose dehydratase|nr:sugar phosphate isomerase/epimerase [Clostridiales bacterium]MDY4199429.1 sugar phosphate isomerase/epimerase [Candidatus Fimadaptatus sp.]
MKLGISSYSLNKRLRTEEMSLFDVIDWAKEHDCAHLELVPFSLPLLKEDGTVDYDYVKRVRDHAEKVGMPLSAFSLNACVIKPTADERKRELDRIRMYMDMAHFLGIKKMRHDTCSGQHPNGINTPEQFEKDFPVFVDAVRELADYAATLGMSTTLENHGLYVNGADRMVRLLNAVDRPNVGMTLDVGNFLCVDDRPEVAVAKCIKYADMIHLKDFYIRKKDRMLPQDGMYTAGAKPAKPYVMPTPEEFRKMPPSLGYVGTASGLNILRGSILGQGDMDIWAILKTVKDAGYDKEVSIEFEGMEDCVAATDICLKTARYIWDRV